VQSETGSNADLVKDHPYPPPSSTECGEWDKCVLKEGKENVDPSSIYQHTFIYLVKKVHLKYLQPFRPPNYR